MPASLLALHLVRLEYWRAMRDTRARARNAAYLCRESGAAAHSAFLDRALRSAWACAAAERIARQNAELVSPRGSLALRGRSTK